MTDYKVLYNPNFVPDALWLRRVLLLTDGVCRIVPDDVRPNDPDGIRRLRDAVPGCLTDVSPGDDDVSVAYGEELRLAQFVEMLAAERHGGNGTLTVEMSPRGHVSVPGHAFVHDAKLSSLVRGLLEQNGLVIEELGRQLAGERFLLVQEEASDLILAGVAARMAGRLGIDAITDKGLPFALNSLRTVSRGPVDAEGALLAALARTSIPDEVAHVSAEDYAELRKTYSGIRESFKVLTAELAAVHRLTKVSEPVRLLERVEAIANEFQREWKKYERSRYARRFKAWTPFVVGAALAVPASLVSPAAGVLLAVGGVVVNTIERCLAPDVNGSEKVFNMLTDLRHDLIDRSRIAQLV